jgi:lipopolysaccharide assembly outer membrane protein LptD (OstA)
VPPVAVLVLWSVLLALLGAGPGWAQPASPGPRPGGVSIGAGEEQATVLADQMQQVGGAVDLMIAIGNVEITRGQSRLLADRVEINRDTGQAVAQGKTTRSSATTPID